MFSRFQLSTIDLFIPSAFHVHSPPPLPLSHSQCFLCALGALCGESLLFFSIYNPSPSINLQIPLPASPLVDFYFIYFHAFPNPLAGNSFVFSSIQNTRVST